MRHFSLGLAAGLLISYGLRRVKADKYNQDRINLYYIRRASSYQDTDNQVRIGNYAPRILLRQKTIEHLNLKTGDKVLDIACGTGSNFPYIMEKIGPTGTLVGVDYSPAMLLEAQKLVDQHGWTNVHLVQHDAATIEMGEQYDAVMCVLGMVVIPDYVNALKRAFEHVKTGGMIAISDLCESQRWYMQPMNALMDALDSTLVIDTTRRPWDLLEPWVKDYRREDIALGYMYIASGQKPQ